MEILPVLFVRMIKRAVEVPSVESVLWKTYKRHQTRPISPDFSRIAAATAAASYRNDIKNRKAQIALYGQIYFQNVFLSQKTSNCGL